MRGQLGDAERTDRIWLRSHALSMFAIGLGAVLLGSFEIRERAVSSVGMILLMGGVIVRVAGMLVRWIARLVR